MIIIITFNVLKTFYKTKQISINKTIHIKSVILDLINDMIIIIKRIVIHFPFRIIT